jgi:hypothetical protein
MLSAFSSMEYPHWLIVAGCVLLVLGFVGLAFRQKGAGSDAETADVGEQGTSESETDLAQTQAANPETRLAEKRSDL